MADTKRSRWDHLAVAREAGLGRVSMLSVLAGTLTAYGAFAVVAAVAGAVLAAADVDTDFQTKRLGEQRRRRWTDHRRSPARGLPVRRIRRRPHGPPSR